MKQSGKKMDCSKWKSVQTHFDTIMKCHYAEDDNSNVATKLLVKGLSHEQIYQQLKKLNTYYLCEQLDKINFQSFACQILALKGQTHDLSANDSVNEDVTKEEVDKDHNNSDPADDCRNSEPSESEASSCHDVFNEDSLDADTFGDIILESSDEEEELDEREPTELDEEGKNMMYNDFFDEEEGSAANPKFNDFFDDTIENEEKSSFQKSIEVDKRQIDEIERENIGEKPWYLKGEVTKSARTEYSVMEENLDFTTALNPRPVETEDLDKKIEAMVLARIKRKAFDNVERKIMPVIDTNDYREKFQVDETKNKKSLADLYVEEFLKKRAVTNKDTPAFLLTGYVAPKDESEMKRNIRYKMANLFKILDGLCHKHNTPYLSLDEGIMDSRTAALAVEEATPVTTSDGMMLAPEEIFARTKTDLKTKPERTISDRKRERRMKKAYQKKQSKKADDNLNKQLKTPSSRSAQSNASVQFVQKAVKRGHVKILETRQPKAVKTSKAFFAAIEERNSNGPPKKKRKVA